MNKWTPFIGHSGLLSQADLDQGDTSQRVGTFATLSVMAGVHWHYRDTSLYEGYSEDLKTLDARGLWNCTKGWYRRCADETKRASNPYAFSRDQKSILMLSMAAMGFRERLLDAYMAQVKRFGFHQNDQNYEDPSKFNFPDIMLPVETAVVIRGLNLWPLYPLLCLIDLGFLVDLLARKKGLWDYDNMMAQQLLYAVTKYPTPVSKLAMKLYLKTDFMDRIKHYHSLEKNGIQPLYELFKLAYDKLTKET